MAKNSGVNQHKRLAMGSTTQGHGQGYARGGTVTPASGVPGRSAPLKGVAISPLTAARRSDGIPEMKKGGAMKKGGKC
jgi:hypothetical protein